MDIIMLLSDNKPKYDNFRLGGYTTGNYTNTCAVCGKDFIGDKMSRQCFDCAIEFANESILELIVLKTKLKELLKE